MYGKEASGGKTKGIDRVIKSSSEIDQVNSGEILVTHHIDPGWTPVFAIISGVMTETGGLLSHSAVVAREYGLPAVLNIQKATSRIKNGQEIELDGDKGLVKILN